MHPIYFPPTSLGAILIIRIDAELANGLYWSWVRQLSSVTLRSEILCCVQRYISVGIVSRFFVWEDSTDILY